MLQGQRIPALEELAPLLRGTRTKVLQGNTHGEEQECSPPSSSRGRARNLASLSKKALLGPGLHARDFKRHWDRGFLEQQIDHFTVSSAWSLSR